MNTVWGISEHAARVLRETVVREMNPQGQMIRELKTTVPLEVLHNCVHTNVFRKVGGSEIETSQRPAIRGKRDAIDQVLMADKVSQQHPVRNAPELDAVVEAAGGQSRSIRRKGDGSHRVRVPDELPHTTTVTNPPEASGFVLAA